MEQKLKRIKKILGSVLLVLVFSSFLILIIAWFLESIRETAFFIAIILSILIPFISAILDIISNVLKDEVLKNDIKEKLYKDDFTKVSFTPSSLDDGIENFMYKILTNTDSDFTFYAKVRKDEKIEIRVIKDNTKLVVQDYMISNYKFFNTYFKIE